MALFITITVVLATIGIGYGLFWLYGYVRDSARAKYGVDLFQVKYIAGYFGSLVTAIAAAVVQQRPEDPLKMWCVVLLVAAAMIALGLSYHLIKKSNILLGSLAAAFQLVFAFVIIGIICAAFSKSTGGVKPKTVSNKRKEAVRKALRKL